mgnify:CR=1 FL=1
MVVIEYTLSAKLSKRLVLVIKYIHWDTTYSASVCQEDQTVRLQDMQNVALSGVIRLHNQVCVVMCYTPT